RGLQVVEAIAQVAAQGERGAPQRAEVSGQGVGVNYGGVRDVAHVRALRIVTVTSSNGTGIGASGLCTVTSTSSTPAYAKRMSAIRCASVSSSLTGSPATAPTTRSARSP